ncbi:HAD family hydrolase [Pseudokineococcus sp. 1T1Z-3]|uniref:HAD family hydrolase n=1 Tax=Pseudokineococcus sp. 1T1Z-3 TaxID=3132745 RepID=UPI0030A47BA1
MTPTSLTPPATRTAPPARGTRRLLRTAATPVAALLLAGAVACTDGGGEPDAGATGTTDAATQAATVWGPELDAVVDAAPEGSYAVFDADNTLWDNDLTEALLAHLEQRGILTWETVDPALQLLPLEEGESLFGYYLRLCGLVGNDACYYWIAASFSGIPLGTLEEEVHAMIAGGEPIPVTYVEDGELVEDEVLPPSIFAEQRELLTHLREQGIRVYLVTAANEEIVRMVVTDDRYGLDVTDEELIGVGLLLRDPDDGELSVSRTLVDDGEFLTADYPVERLERSVLTPTLVDGTWYVGKKGAIEHHIDPYRYPVVVAGDASSDWHMLFGVDTSSPTSGVRLWVDKGSPGVEALQEEQQRRVALQEAAGVEPDADDGWLVLEQEELGAE